MSTRIRKLEEILTPGDRSPAPEWQLRSIQSEQCVSYVAWNERTREALVVDPKDEDIEAYSELQKALQGYLWLGVIDTHTHADHISVASQLAHELHAPLIMHANAPSRRVQIRVSQDTMLPTHAAPLELLHTPGHTQDSITPIWGPFLFGGDTVLYGDTGRDDLPGGDAEAHYASIRKLAEHARADMIVLPGHDHQGGRASSWATQLKVNSALTQAREPFVSEASAFNAPAPRLLKESLRANFK